MKTIDKLWGYIETCTSVAAMLIMTVSIFMQVIFRYMIQSALPWSEELARYAMIYLTFIGVSAGTKSGAHFSVTAIVDVLPAKLRKYVNMAEHTISTVLFSVYLIMSAQMVMSIYSTHQLTPAMQLPIFIIYLSLPLGFAGTIFRYIQILVNDIRDLKNTDAASPA